MNLVYKLIIHIAHSHTIQSVVNAQKYFFLLVCPKKQFKKPKTMTEWLYFKNFSSV